MSLYLEVLKKSFYSEYIYKANTFIKIIRNVIIVLVLISIWSNLLKLGSVSEIDIPGMMTYIILAMFIRNLVYSDVADVLIAKIRDGSISSEFIRPVRLNLYLFFSQMGRNFFNVLFSTIPVLVTALFFLKFTVPLDPIRWLLFTGSVVLSVLLMFLVYYCFALLIFWLKTGLFINMLLGALFEIFGGITIPLWFYPKGLITVGKYLPFRLVFFEPISIFLEKSTISQSVVTIIVQFIWIIGLFILQELIWQRAQKVVTVQGG